MSRAAVTYKTKQELLGMKASELDAYIEWLRMRVNHLGTSPAKAVNKLLEVAQKIRADMV